MDESLTMFFAESVGTTETPTQNRLKIAYADAGVIGRTWRFGMTLRYDFGLFGRCESTRNH